MGVLYARKTPQDNFTPVSTMGVGNASQSQRGLMTAQDKVKLDEMLPNPPSSNGTYTLTCTVSGGTVTYEWV